MASVVHGLEQDYAGRIDFLYLNVADSGTSVARRIYGFKSTPHFFFLRADGSAVGNIQGVVPRDSLRHGLDALAAAPVAPSDAVRPTAPST
jgi:thioredoxin-like negative regulator of GroEL